MQRATVEELRKDAGLLVTQAANGEHIAVTMRGVPAAVLVSWRDYLDEETITAPQNIGTA